MPIQDERALTMEALSVLDDAPPHPKQPALENGVHLRWAPGKSRGFPLAGGYFLFRRALGPTGARQCLMTQLSDVDVRLIESKPAVTTLVGTLTNVAGLKLKGAQPPSSNTVTGWGFILLENQPLRFSLPAGLTAGSVTVSTRFLQIPPTSTPFFRAEFALTDVGVVSTPIVKEGASFQPFAARGGPELTGSIVNGVEYINLAALICNSRVEVKLPGPCKIVRAQVGKGGVTIESFEENGTLAQRKQMTTEEYGLTDVSGSRVTRVVISGRGVRIYGVYYEFAEPRGRINVVGSFQGSEVFKRSVNGVEGDQHTITVDITSVDSLLISGGPAAVLDICYTPRRSPWPETSPSVGTNAPALPGKNWEMVPNLSTAITLPIVHPSYSASTGTESIQAATQIAKTRLRYGTWQDSFQSAGRQTTTGTITLTNGSAIAIGTGTNWASDLVGKMICLPKTPQDFVAYTVMAVLAPGRLVLSRSYSGVTQINAPYQVMEGDHFAELHDQIACLFSQPADMRQASAPPLLDQGTLAGGKFVLVRPGSQTITGMGTQWTASLIGSYIEIGPKWYIGFHVEERSVFRIQAVDAGSQQITLDRIYPGPFTIASFQVKADFRIVVRSGPEAPDIGPPSLEFKPMDFIELASLIPSYAQVLGLYWIDSSAVRGGLYDYIVLADHNNRFSRQAANALNWLNGSPDFSTGDVDGYVVLGVKHFGSAPLPAPSQMALYRLPSGGNRSSVSRPNLADSDVGISVLEAASWPTRPDQQRPVMLNLWRLFRGTDAKNLAPVGDLTKYNDLGKVLPVAQATSAAQKNRPPGWPLDPLHFIDAQLDVGWYSYAANVNDVFGRWSAPSNPIPWVGEKDPSAPQITDAIHLADHTPPPPPTGVSAWALDPEDPYVVKDAAYQAWKNQWVQAKQPEPVGLRIQWRWPWFHRNQGPDLREFRIYYQSKPLNARTGKSVSVSPVSGDATRSTVAIDLGAPDLSPPNAYANASLQVGDRSFPIVASTGGATVKLTVVNGGVTKNETPVAGEAAAIVIPHGHPLHKELLDPRNWEKWLAAVPENTQVRHEVEMLEDPSIKTFDHSENTFTGSVAKWNGAAIVLDKIPSGNSLAKVRPGIDVIALLSVEPQAYHVLDLKSVNATTLQLVPAQAQGLVAGRSYEWRIGPPNAGLQGIAGKWKPGGKQFELDGNLDLTGVRPGVDMIYIPTVAKSSSPANLNLFYRIEAVDRAARVLTLGSDSEVLPNQAPSSWKIGRPLRFYDVFLPSGPAAPKHFDIDQLLKPSLQDPVAYGSVGVSSADWRDEVADWMPGRNLEGNEGSLSASAAVFRVYRKPPPEPEYDWGVTRLLATEANYRVESFATIRWRKPAIDGDSYSAHICRAMDDSLFLAHWKKRDQLSNPPANIPEPDRTKLADLLTNIRSSADYASVSEFYGQLDDAALAWLAGVPELEEAYMQITIEPLRLGDPANRDRLCPDDDPKTFKGPDPAVCAYTDALPGRSTNRYFYRVALVDGANNRGKMGRPTPPVYLPKVVPPRTPVITKVIGGDRQITFKWVPNREPDLSRYAVYRTDQKEAAQDIRLMTVVHTEDVETPLESQGTELEWVDEPVVGLMTFYYRLVAVDQAGNMSAPSPVASGRAFDDSRPDHPDWNAPTEGTNPGDLVLSWSSATPDLRCLVQRRLAGGTLWKNVSNWLPRGTYTYTDNDRNLDLQYEYRLRVMDNASRINNAHKELTA